MRKDEFAKLLETIQAEEKEVREAGQKEYAHSDDDCFRNFNVVGEMVPCPHCHRPIGAMATLMVYKLKHVFGILAYMGGHRSQREDVRGRIKDDRMYSALLRGMVEDESTLDPADADWVDITSNTDIGRGQVRFKYAYAPGVFWCGRQGEWPPKLQS